jgi:plasmid stability protein
MKTTLDLPDALVKQVKLRALRQGRKLKDAVADLLRKGLAAEKDVDSERSAPIVARDKTTRLPLIQCKHAASPQDEMTPERVADMLLAQEAGWHDAAGRQ